MNDSQIIDSLGGTGAVAKLCDVSASAVSQWRTNGIPRAHRRYLALLRPDVFAAAEVVTVVVAKPEERAA